MKKNFVFDVSEDGRLYTTTLTSGRAVPGGRSERKLTVTVAVDDNGYVRLHKAVQEVDGASWEYDGSIDYDLDRFEKDNPSLIGKIARAVRELRQ